MKNKIFGVTAMVGVLLLPACDGNPSDVASSEQAKKDQPVVANGQAVDAAKEDFETWLQMQLLEAKPGDVIALPEGTFDLIRGLSLAVDGVTIRGGGPR